MWQVRELLFLSFIPATILHHPPPCSHRVDWQSWPEISCWSSSPWLASPLHTMNLEGEKQRLWRDIPFPPTRSINHLGYWTEFIKFSGITVRTGQEEEGCNPFPLPLVAFSVSLMLGCPLQSTGYCLELVALGSGEVCLVFPSG